MLLEKVIFNRSDMPSGSWWKRKKQKIDRFNHTSHIDSVKWFKNNWAHYMSHTINKHFRSQSCHDWPIFSIRIFYYKFLLNYCMAYGLIICEIRIEQIQFRLQNVHFKLSFLFCFWWEKQQICWAVLVSETSIVFQIVCITYNLLTTLNI